MKIILLTGKARSGKNCVASICKDFLEKRNKKVLSIAYGDYLKELAKKYCNWNGEKDNVGREILQKLGTDIVREELGMENFWVDHVVHELIIAERLGFEYGIVEDARFENENTIPRKMFNDSVTIKIERPNFESDLTKEQLQHKSETQLDNIKSDITINNNGTLEELYMKVISRMEEIL